MGARHWTPAPLSTSIGSVVIALVIGAWSYMAFDRGNLGAPFTGYRALAVGASGRPTIYRRRSSRPRRSSSAGLGVAFAFRGGLFNIGGEGQFYAGALASTYVGYVLHWPVAASPVCCLVAMLAGGLWAAIPGILKAYRGAHEVITTVMLNYVAADAMHYLLDSSSTGAPAPWEALSWEPMPLRS